MPGGYIYKKGANFERGIVSLFWENGWAAVRAAGSGTTKYPVPDVVAVKDCEVVLVECKTTSKDRIHLKAAVEGFKRFARISGARAYISVKFDREKPRFYDICEILVAGKYTVTKKTEYLSFESLIGRQSRLSF
ncbi:MAG: Holliday junction resolvase Hjc [Candidatus Altiarchaeota archaeon]